MRKALAITHVSFEDLGSLRPALEEAGFDVQQMDACTADLSATDFLEADLVVVLGGPIGVYQADAYPFIDAEIALLRARLAAHRPLLGICLGAQLMAAALGARVYAGSSGKELGWASIAAGTDANSHPWFAPLLDVPVLHWHGDTFDLPAQAHHLASTSRYVNQAFAIDRHALALQFHPEVTAAGLERWYVGHACELGQAGVDIRRLREASHSAAPGLEAAAQRFWRGWLAHVFAGTD